MKPQTIGPITVESSSVMLGQSLQQHVRERVTLAISKSFNSLISATVHFNEDGSLFNCTVQMNVGGGQSHKANGEAKGTDCYKAFHLALSKAAKQLSHAKSLSRDSKPVRTDKSRWLNDGVRGTFGMEDAQRGA